LGGGDEITQDEMDVVAEGEDVDELQDDDQTISIS
jgi:hypothetical protein